MICFLLVQRLAVMRLLTHIYHSTWGNPRKISTEDNGVGSEEPTAEKKNATHPQGFNHANRTGQIDFFPQNSHRASHTPLANIS